MGKEKKYQHSFKPICSQAYTLPSRIKTSIKRYCAYAKKQGSVIWQSLIEPSRLFVQDWSRQAKYIILSFYILFLLSGTILNLIWTFPNFFFFQIAFSTIFTTVVYSLHYFFHNMRLLCVEVISYPPFEPANWFYLEITKKSTVYLFFPLFFIGAFGIGGSIIYKAILFTPTFIWCLVYFVIVVFFSMLAYLQYARFFIYLQKVAKCEKSFEHIIDPENKELPPNLTWLIRLTRVSHTMRNMFFIVGVIYIVAFSVFCFSPIYNININGFIFYSLWSIIFFFIVLTFPFVTSVNIIAIKKLVVKVKDAYVQELLFEERIGSLVNSGWDIKVFSIVRNYCIIMIQKMPNYPLKGYLNIGYSVIATLLNLSASLVTLLQYNGMELF